MTIWIDAQLSPPLAPWLAARFGVDAKHIRDADLLGLDDREIFAAARRAGALGVTKDRDFVDLVKRRGTPPQIIWVTCGNTSNRAMRRILERCFERVLQLLDAGEPVVEIKG